MGARALRRFVEHAVERHAPAFEGWFPASFDWRRFCADVPEMARRREGGPLGHARETHLEQSACATFRAAHLTALAVLSAAAEGGDDPDALLGRLVRSPDDEEEMAFARLAAGSLQPTEEALAGGVETRGAAGGGDEATGHAARLTEAAWPSVAQLLVEDPSGLLGPASADAAVLWSVARVAAILASFRWMTVAAVDEDWPDVAPS